MSLQLMGLEDFLTMVAPGAGRRAQLEKDEARSCAFLRALFEAEQNGVDDSAALLYAQAQLIDFDKGNTQ